MKKAEILSSLQEARLAHAKWVLSGRKLLDGVDLDQVQRPLKCTDCTFGKWFYSHHAYIKNVSGFTSIEELHFQFHHIYETLYTNAPRVHKSKGVFSNKKLQATQKKFLEKDFVKLENTSKKMIRKLVQVEKTVEAMSERLFERQKKQLQS